MRKLYSATAHCNAGCKYCFTKWDGIYAEQPVFGVEHTPSKEAVVYPCCDGEFFAQSNYIEIAKSMMKDMDKIYFSISTKSVVTDQMLSTIADLNNLLRSENKGFVKFSISVSNKTQVDVLEPETLTYSKRLETAHQLVSAGIPSSLTLKPVLPFISNEEYFSILSDFSSVINRVLIGGLYVCPNTKFYKEYIEGKYSTEKREVEWLVNKPVWDYVEDANKTEQLKNFGVHLGMQIYDSDIEVIKSYIEDGV